MRTACLNATVIAKRNPENARPLAYRLLADALQAGPTDQSRELLTASPRLREALSRYAESDALLADHQHAFGWSLTPLKGMFVAFDRQSGGSTTDRLVAAYREAGFSLDPRGDEPEHLSTLLRCLARIAADDSEGRAAARFIDSHLLDWLPAFARGVSRTGKAWPIALATQIEELVLEHRASLPLKVSGPSHLQSSADEEGDLRALAAWLATPAHSGLVLSRDDIARVGRSLNVPRGFGDRVQLILNLLRGAAHFEAIDELWRSLEEECASQAAALSSERYREVTACTAVWVRRLRHTREWLGAQRRACSVP